MSTLTTWNLVAETKEWVGPIDVTVNGTPVTGFQVSVCEGQQRPTTWLSADADPDGGSAVGVLVGAGAAWALVVNKIYTIFVKYTDTPEIPIQRAGKIKVS